MKNILKIICLGNFILYSQITLSSLHFLKLSNLSGWEKTSQENKKKIFSKILCKKQLELNRIPLACFALSEKRKEAGALCLKLSLKTLNKALLEKALKNKDLPRTCWQRLLYYQKLLDYRKIDAKLYTEFYRQAMQQTLKGD